MKGAAARRKRGRRRRKARPEGEAGREGDAERERLATGRRIWDMFFIGWECLKLNT
jgi:hypothetical protein